MGHAYLKASDNRSCHVTTCSPRGRDETMMDTFVNASVKHAGERAAPKKRPLVTRAKKPG